MKQVNRIRFNSITTTSGAALQKEGVTRHFRTNSCPSLDSCDSSEVGDATSYTHTHHPSNGAPVNIDVSAVQSTPAMSQGAPLNTTEEAPFNKVKLSDSVTTTESYTTASHPTMSEDFQVTFPYNLLLASLPCAPLLRCYNCLRREQCRSDTPTSTRGQCGDEDSAQKLPGSSSI